MKRARVAKRQGTSRAEPPALPQRLPEREVARFDHVLDETFHDHVALILIGDGGTVAIPRTVHEPRPTGLAGSAQRSAHEARARPERTKCEWVSVSGAAAILGFGTVGFRRLLERNARRTPDGGIEASVDGVRARKLGRTWRVQLGDAWTTTSAAPRRGGRVVHEVGGNVRRGGNE